jgi:hypothetical protein
MTNRIFKTLKSRLPAGARPESIATIDAVAASIAAFKQSADKIAQDARFSAVGKTDALAALRKSTVEQGRLAELRSVYRSKSENIRGEQEAMRRTALNRPDSADIGAMLRRELRDGEMRAMLRSLPPGERLSALADPEIARAVASSMSALLSGIPPEVHVALVEKLTGEAIAAKFGDRAAQFAADAEEIEAVTGAIEVAVGLIERE